MIEGLSIMSISLGIFASMTQGGAAVSVASGTKVVCSSMTASCGRPSETLLQTIEEILSRSNLSFTDLDVICSDIGPGSFTGIRVGLAALFGFVKALEIKSLGLSSLHLIALAHFRALSSNSCTDISSQVSVLPIIAAGRGEYFGAVYKSGCALLAEEITKPALLSLEEVELLSREHSAVLVAINDSVPCDIGCSLHVLMADCADIAALAAVIALDTDKLDKGFAEPLYIRRSWAEEAKDSRGK